MVTPRWSQRPTARSARSVTRSEGSDDEIWKSDLMASLDTDDEHFVDDCRDLGVGLG